MTHRPVFAEHLLRPAIDPATQPYRLEALVAGCEFHRTIGTAEPIAMRENITRRLLRGGLR